MTPQELAEQYADVEYGVGSRTYPEARRFWEGGVTDFLAGYNKAIEIQKEAEKPLYKFKSSDFRIGDKVYVRKDVYHFTVVNIQEDKIALKGDWYRGECTQNAVSWVEYDDILSKANESIDSDLAGQQRQVDECKKEVAALQEKIAQLNLTIDYYEERKVKMQEEIDRLKERKK